MTETNKTNEIIDQITKMRHTFIMGHIRSIRQIRQIRQMKTWSKWNKFDIGQMRQKKKKKEHKKAAGRIVVSLFGTLYLYNLSLKIVQSLETEDCAFGDMLIVVHKCYSQTPEGC